MKELTRDEWFRWREAGITGSEAPIIMKKSPWCTPELLWDRRMGLAPEQEMTYPMRRGLKLEPEARAFYEHRYGVEVPARCLTSEVWDVARASLDGLNENVEHAIEIKCPGKEDHILALTGKVPEKYVWQLVHQCMVTGYDTIAYVSYNPGFPEHYQLAVVVFKRDMKMENLLLIEERKFWEALQKGIRPGKPNPKVPAKKETSPAKKSRAMVPPKNNVRRATVYPFRTREK